MPSKNHRIHECFQSLDDGQPWTASLASLIQHLGWETGDLLGKSKSKLVEDTVLATIEEYKNGETDSDTIMKKIKNKMQAQVKSSTADERYSKPITGSWISPYEAQRRIRYFSEDFLNREFDIFMSLLPDNLISEYLQSHFPAITDDGGSWRVYGHSNEFDLSVGSAGQHDTIAYNNKSGCLVGIEIKIDAKVQDDQLLKYCCIYHDLASKKFMSGKDFHFLVVTNDILDTDSINTIRSNAQNKLYELISSPESVKQSLLRYQDAHEHIYTIINEVKIASTSWQQLGEHFNNILINDAHNNDINYLNKLIGGFVDSLSKKYSKKLSRTLYQFPAVQCL